MGRKDYESTKLRQLNYRHFFDTRRNINDEEIRDWPLEDVAKSLNISCKSFGRRFANAPAASAPKSTAAEDQRCQEAMSSTDLHVKDTDR
jgi:hypothetical protein